MAVSPSHNSKHKHVAIGFNVPAIESLHCSQGGIVKLFSAEQLPSLSCSVRQNLLQSCSYFIITWCFYKALTQHVSPWPAYQVASVEIRFVSCHVMSGEEMWDCESCCPVQDLTHGFLILREEPCFKNVFMLLSNCHTFDTDTCFWFYCF